MFRKIYKIAIDGHNSIEVLNSLLDTFNLYGDVINVTENPLVNTKTKDEVYKVIVFEVRARKSKFERLLNLMKDTGHPLNKIRGVWFM